MSLKATLFAYLAYAAGFAPFCYADGITAPIALTPATSSIVMVAAAPYPNGGCSNAGSGQGLCSSAFSPSGLTLNYSNAGTVATVNSSTTYGNDPSVSGGFTVTGPLAPATQYGFLSIVAYQFEVDGPSGAMADITIAADGAASQSSPGTDSLSFGSDAVMSVHDTSGNLLLREIACTGNFYLGCSSPSFTYDGTLLVDTNTVYNFQIFTQDILESSNSVSGSATYSSNALVDPTISLDTSNPAYSLDVSAAPTPEPNYLAISGLAALAGWFARYRSSIRDLPVLRSEPSPLR